MSAGQSLSPSAYSTSHNLCTDFISCGVSGKNRYYGTYCRGSSVGKSVALITLRSTDRSRPPAHWKTSPTQLECFRCGRNRKLIRPRHSEKEFASISLFLTCGRSSTWFERPPVTGKVAGSNPVGRAASEASELQDSSSGRISSGNKRTRAAECFLESATV